MSNNRYYYDEFAEEIWDEELQDYPANWQICDTLNKQDETIDRLKQHLAKKDKELKQKNKTIKKYIRYNDELANALVEKPEQLELYQLREDNKVLSMNRDNYVNAKLKEQRHQICEKIRNEIVEITGFSVEELKKIRYDLNPKAIFDILDKLEKGE